MNKIIYITSLSHSGSTLLNLLLGRHPKIIGLGETNNSIRKINKEQNICTCGSSAFECEIWGEVLRKEIDNKYDSITDIYTDLFQLVHNKYGKDKIICDSSKNIKWFDEIDKQIIDNKVIFLVKDVRAYTHSLVRKNRKIINKSLKHKLLDFKITHYFFWYQKNLEILNYLKKNNVDYLLIGYDELCFKPEKMMKMICQYLELDYKPNMTNPLNESSHIIRGNRMRYDPDKTKNIVYDYEWIRNNNQLLSILKPILNLNKRLVYNNS